MNRQTTIRAIARRTGLTYFQVQRMLEALIEVWGEALADGGQISLQDFLTIKVTTLKTHRRGQLRHHTSNTAMVKTAYRVDTRLSEHLKQKLRRKT